MRFGILGTTRAWRADGSEVPLGGPARRALLAVLIARPGEPVSPESLIDQLYGEQPPKGAKHAIHSQVSRLRGSGLRIEQHDTGYRLDAAREDVDAHEFLRLAQEGRPHEALSLWHGRALADLPTQNGFAAMLEERRLETLETRIEADLAKGVPGLAAELTALTAEHPLRERLRALLMRALHAEGRQAEALTAYEDTRRLLADELGADPTPELSRVHEAILRGEVKQRHRPITSFVGRDHDVAGVRDLLGRARLVTLLGPGGAGKTRLSVEVTAHQQDVCFVELASVRDGIERAVLAALGVRDSSLPGPAEDPMKRLVAALRERSPLLVLDNCEHLVADVAALAERLLHAHPDLRVLATSREPLGITAEHLWPVRSLAPGDAVRLFTDRAAAVRPGFVPDEAVERICRELDGLPLAIELAAARMRTHEAAELAGRLGDRFRLLSRGSRTADARHQTLRAVVAWSWDLLLPEERDMAARLTVFTGSATADAAERVCGVDADVLDSLADKSLLEVSGGRYRMLETIRAFCAEQLDGDEYHRVHATSFADLAERMDPQLRRADQLRRLEELGAEHDNLMGALRWCVEAGEAALGMRLLGALSTYLWMRGLHGSVVAQARALLAMAGQDAAPRDYVLCSLISGSSDLAAAERYVAEHNWHPLVVYLWPMITAGTGDPGTAIKVVTRGRQSEDPWERACAHLVWGYPRVAAGDFDAAEDEFTSALDGFRALGERWGSAMALDSLSWLADTSGDPAKAFTRIEEALELTEELGADQDVSDLLCNRGDYRIHDDLAGARADYERAAELARRAGSATYLATALRGLADVARLEGDQDRARTLYEQALERIDQQWVRSAGNRVRSLVGLGLVTGDPAHFHRALEVAVHSGALPEGARAIEELARLAPDPARAAELRAAAAVLKGTEPSKIAALRLAGVSEEVIGNSPVAVVSDW